ncbi:hypothetical protein PGB34_22195 [Xenophilus arseniciresistens]|uniref:Uncharacterized protein n=1 Tax=Xenophilus arseniciresistens TaxID=1283306 RepID=A0AAE3T348_9BURK|nr:hypothetical protein [Xenophilus arseniciresistens]MDA7419092.1 hypothetical protein [Xenophilus arseniciresistens]
MNFLKIPGLALGSLCALVGGAQAVGPTGPVGPVGAAGGTSTTTTTVIDNPGSGTNRIEVTGNTARNIVVQCAHNGQAPAQAAPNVNSVNVDGRALQGRTVIITGRNTQDIDARVDCNNSNSTDGRTGAANVNSVNIR